MVAREAEVAVGTIYLYFSSRDDLYLSLVVERAERLRSRYLEIQSRGLAPLDELRAVAGAYLDHLRDSREIFLSQQSAAFEQLRKRLRRPSEIRHFKRVMDLGHEIFGIWESTIGRCFDAGLIANAMGPTRTAAVMWASLNGAFMLMGDDNFFRDVTGLNPEHFVEEALESHLVTATQAEPPRDREAAASHRSSSTLSKSASMPTASSNSTRKSKSSSAARSGRAKHNGEKQPDELAAIAPA
jgi:AcrR family transcriptional regulator